MSDQETGHAPVIVALPSQIDATCPGRAYDRLYAAFASGAPVVIADFTGTAFCDIASLRRLVTIRQRAVARVAQLRLVIPPGGLVHRLAALLGLDRQLPVYPALWDALAAGTLAGPNEPVTPRRPASRPATMADINGLTGTSQLHILRWQAWLGELGRHLGAPPPGPALGATWDTVAALIDLHMQADDEVCAPAIYHRTPGGRALARECKDTHAEIGEMIAETRLHPLGATSWWHLATATLAAWSRQSDYEEHGPSAQCRRRADPALRQQLARQWRAFRQARILDRWYPDPPPQLPTCQLRLAHPATPRLANPVFCPLACTCLACEGKSAELSAIAREG